MIGSDGKRHRSTGVEAWIKEVEDGGDAVPLTLFLLDICHAGRAARLSWELQRHDKDQPPRAWVIAATTPDQQAFDCRFSRAVATVLRQAADRQLDVDDSVEFLPWSLVRGRIKDQVVKQAGTGPPQRVTSTLLDDDVEAPFFRNPHDTPPGPLDRARAAAPHAVTPFVDSVEVKDLGVGAVVDEGVDAAHFEDRASGRRPTPAQYVQYLSSYVWGRVIRWLRRKHRRITAMTGSCAICPNGWTAQSVWIRCGWLLRPEKLVDWLMATECGQIGCCAMLLIF